MTPRICPACGLDLPANATSHWRYCSPRCRRWVSRAGGPIEAAAILEAWADQWADAPNDAEAREKRLRARAEMLRRMVATST